MDWSSDVCSSYLFHVNGRFQPSPDPASCDQASEWGKATLRRQITDTAQGREIGQRQMQPDHRSFTAGTTEEIGRAHVSTPVTNAHLVCRLLLEKKKKKQQTSTNYMNNSKPHTQH